MKKYNILCDKDMNIFDTIDLLKDLSIKYTLSKPVPDIIPYNKRVFVEHSNKRSIYPDYNTDLDRVEFKIRTSFWINYKPFSYKIQLTNKDDYDYIKWLVKSWRKMNKYYDTDVSKYFKEEYKTPCSN